MLQRVFAYTRNLAPRNKIIVAAVALLLVGAAAYSMSQPKAAAPANPVIGTTPAPKATPKVAGEATGTQTSAASNTTHPAPTPQTPPKETTTTTNTAAQTQVQTAAQPIPTPPAAQPTPPVIPPAGNCKAKVTTMLVTTTPPLFKGPQSLTIPANCLSQKLAFSTLDGSSIQWWPSIDPDKVPAPVVIVPEGPAGPHTNPSYSFKVQTRSSAVVGQYIELYFVIGSDHVTYTLGVTITN